MILTRKGKTEISERKKLNDNCISLNRAISFTFAQASKANIEDLVDTL